MSISSASGNIKFNEMSLQEGWRSWHVSYDEMLVHFRFCNGSVIRWFCQSCFLSDDALLYFLTIYKSLLYAVDFILKVLVKKRVQKRDEVLKIHHALSGILCVMSSTWKVDFDRLRELCTETYVFILKEFNWVCISESLHDVLAHSHQLIEENDGYGLGLFTEQGSEGTLSNKAE